MSFYLVSMKRAKRLMSVLAIGACLSAGSGRSGQEPLSQGTTRPNDQDQGLATALARAKKEYEEANTNPTPREIPLPNFNAGPGLPRPMGTNAYETRKYYPGYLLCTYDVSENHYDQSNEPAWFEAALRQMRSYGSKRFPPFNWVAVVIKNDAEHKGASTFEQSHKVGAIFKARDVFDISQDPQRLIAQAKMDRHPFVLDPKRETPGEQQQWTIVDRHAAAEAKGTSN